MNKTVKLDVNNTALEFDVTAGAYDKYINEITLTNKIAPAKNFLTRTVKNDCKEALKEVLDLPGAAVQLCAALIEEYAPDLEITVGK